MENNGTNDINKMYEEFSYKNGILNDIHINFTEKYGELPSEIKSTEDRELVSEYCRMQLEQGNLSGSQRDMLEKLSGALNAPDSDPAEDKSHGFVEAVQKMSGWADKVQEKTEKEKIKPERNYDPSL